MTLVIMAAGMGTRFGGLKQLQAIDNNGNFIIDYSIYDAIKAGFNKIVFVIKRENLEAFQSTITNRLPKSVKVEFVFQDMDSFVPNEYLNSMRKKPWGTGHAILCTKNAVKENFAIINADDFYGRGAYAEAYKFLTENKVENDFSMVGYKIANTLTENGEVKRGICKQINGNLTEVDESIVSKQGDKIIAKSMVTSNVQTITDNELTSMNLFCFTPSLFKYLEEKFEDFLRKNKDDLSTCEYLIPTILSEYINEKKGNIKVLSTTEKWFGLTYREDYSNVVNNIKSLVDKGVYPKNLWGI